MSSSGPPRTTRPPLLAGALIRIAADPVTRSAQLGDLEEEFNERAVADLAAARRWYWRQVLGSVAPNVAGRVHRERRTRFVQGDGMSRTMLQDVGYALRSVRKNAAFSAALVLSLSLGIGANTTIFSAVHGLVLRPFPFPEPDRIVGVGTAYPKLGVPLGFLENASPAEFIDLREQSRTLEGVVAWDMGNRQIAGEGAAENVFTGFWWGDALRTLGMDAHLGRGFSDAEVEQGAQVALLSYRIWRDRFGADSTLVGRDIVINDAPHTLVGILPEGVTLYGMDLWMVMSVTPSVFPRDRRQFQILARIRDGMTLREVNTELDQLARRTEQVQLGEFEHYEGWSMRASRWSEVSSSSYRAGAFVTLAAVGFVLLLVCANSATLLLARAQRRKREMALRATLGAGRGRLLFQLLVESVALALVGGTLGVGFAWFGVMGVRELLAALAAPVVGGVSLNVPALLFTATVAVGSGLLFGLAPALHMSRVELGGVLQVDGKGTTAGVVRQRMQRTFVAVEVALAFVLLAGSGLLMSSLVRLNRVDAGFREEDLLAMRLTLPYQQYQGDAIPAFFGELRERAEAIPGVQSAAVASQYPPDAFLASELTFEASAAPPDATLPRALLTIVSSSYFETLGVPLVAGRAFGREDGADTPAVAVINEAAARRFFPAGDVLGKRFKPGGADSDNPWFEIVGVVGDTRNRGLDRPGDPEVFGLLEQVGQVFNQSFLILRSADDPYGPLPAVRRVVEEMDSDQPIYAVQTVEEAFASDGSSRRATTIVLTLFGGLALLLAAVGVYAVVSFSVSARTQEIGLRVALGASRSRVRSLVVRQALVPVLVGAVLGAALMVPLGAGLRQLLFEVSETDPATLVGVSLVLLGVATAASAIPAMRASRLDPGEALRVD